MGICRNLGVAALVAFIVGCSPAQSQVPPLTELSPSISLHLLLGNPSGATPTKLTPDNYLMVKNQYALSYNNSFRSTSLTQMHSQGYQLKMIEKNGQTIHRLGYKLSV
ncbi:hypothetical protein [Nostoc sp. CENA543]|uniref:hypothetical protein n=1 Tax=Nostoc sp. CENA543 TaxID=1869241 RepID=UPI0035B5003F